MAIRTIDAPGIEIHEIDKSQYSPAMTGTKVLVTGFANQGEDYIPMIFTSKSAWLNYYGEPDNEAERYFYAASMEVLNQNGVVNCCKLPYENEARDKFVGQKYKLVATKVLSVHTPYEILTQPDFIQKFGNLYSVISSTTAFNKDVLKYFLANYKITDSTDKKTVLSAVTECPALDDFDSILGLSVNPASVECVGKVRDDVISAFELRTDEYTLKELGCDSVSEDGHFEKPSKNFRKLYADGIGRDDLADGFISEMTKAQLFSYLDEVTVLPGIMPKFNVYWKVDTDYDHTFVKLSATAISELTEANPIINSMASAVVDCVQWIEDVGDRYVDITAFNDTTELKDFDDYDFGEKTVSQLMTAIDELDSLVNPNAETRRGDKVRDYYDCLKAITEKGQLSSVTLSAAGVKQSISVMLAYNENVDTAVLTAESEFMYPRVSSDFTIQSLENLVYSNYPDPAAEATADSALQSIFVEFLADRQTEITAYGNEPSEDSPLVVRYRNGFNAFQLLNVNDGTSGFDGEAALTYKNKALDVLNFTMVETKDDFADAADYFAKMKANSDATKRSQIDNITAALQFCEVKLADPTVDEYWKIEAKGKPYLLTMDAVDEYRTDESRVGTNEILIVDKTRKPYVKIPEDKNHKNDGRELIGVIPIITTAANALYAQSMIDVADRFVTEYETVKLVQTLNAKDQPYTYLGKQLSTFNEIKSDLSGVSIISQRLNNEHTDEDNADDFFDSLALEANNYFPGISLQGDGSFDRENMKKIGLVVVKAFLDASEGNKISFQLVESFVGSLDRDAKNPNTGATTFIDTIVNEQS